MSKILDIDDLKCINKALDNYLSSKVIDGVTVRNINKLTKIFDSKDQVYTYRSENFKPDFLKLLKEALNHYCTQSQDVTAMELLKELQLNH